MNILLDTHVLIWALENNPTLSDKARYSIIKANNMVFVSAVSIWEIGIKRSLGKLETPDNLMEEIKLHRFTPLNISYDHAELAGKLPDIHKDPFDRMLIAQSITDNFPIMTDDSKIALYHCRVM
jgi:PIN domain nuclease of toxin-antitoxin system